MGISIGILEGIKRRNGIVLKTFAGASKGDVNRIRELIESGLTRNQCAEILGVTHGVVSGLVTRHNIKSPLRLVLFSPARDAVIKQHYSTCMGTEELTDICNKLPGAEVTKLNVVNRAFWLKIKRPVVPGRVRMQAAVKARAIKAQAARPKKHFPPVLQDPPPPEGWMPGGARPPIGRTLDEIKSLATREGILVQNLNDVIGYNKHRMRRNLAPYAVTNLPQQWRR